MCVDDQRPIKCFGLPGQSHICLIILAKDTLFRDLLLLHINKFVMCFSHYLGLLILSDARLVPK